MSAELRDPFSERAAIDIIWNVTAICPWNCPICCVDAVHVTRKSGQVALQSRDLKQTERIAFEPGSGSTFDQALAWRQQHGYELSLAAKMNVLENARGYNVTWDFSGGDVLVASENMLVLRRAAELYGREHVTLTATGAGLSGYDAESLAPYISEMNFTFDSAPAEVMPTRPAGYASGNLKKAKEFVRVGIPTRAECPLTIFNCEPAELERIYETLSEAEVQTLLLMRLFPSGRGANVSQGTPTPDQYRRAISTVRELEARHGFPRVRLQCALRYFDDPGVAVNPCDLVSGSFGLMWDGTLLSSPWAINASGRPIDTAFVLGNLAETELSQILASEKVASYRQRLDENRGHCKVLAFWHSDLQLAFERIFDRSDPLARIVESGPISPSDRAAKEEAR